MGKGSLACAGPASGGRKRTWAAVGVDGRASRRAALGAREQVQQTCHEERSRAVGGGLAGVASGIGAVRGANGRLAVVQGGTGAGMRPPARLAGEGCGGRAARGPERGWWHLAKKRPLLLLQLGGLASAVDGGVRGVVLAGHDEDPSTWSPCFAWHAPTRRQRGVER